MNQEGESDPDCVVIYDYHDHLIVISDDEDAENCNMGVTSNGRNGQNSGGSSRNRGTHENTAESSAVGSSNQSVNGNTSGVNATASKSSEMESSFQRVVENIEHSVDSSPQNSTSPACLPSQVVDSHGNSASEADTPTCSTLQNNSSSKPISESQTVHSAMPSPDNGISSESPAMPHNTTGVYATTSQSNAMESSTQTAYATTSQRGAVASSVQNDLSVCSISQINQSSLLESTNPLSATNNDLGAAQSTEIYQRNTAFGICIKCKRHDYIEPLFNAIVTTNRSQDPSQERQNIDNTGDAELMDTSRMLIAEYSLLRVSYEKSDAASESQLEDTARRFIAESSIPRVPYEKSASSASDDNHAPSKVLYSCNVERNGNTLSRLPAEATDTVATFHQKKNIQSEIEKENQISTPIPLEILNGNPVPNIRISELKTLESAVNIQLDDISKSSINEMSAAENTSEISISVSVDDHLPTQTPRDLIGENNSENEQTLNRKNIESHDNVVAFQSTSAHQQDLSAECNLIAEAASEEQQSIEPAPSANDQLISSQLVSIQHSNSIVAPECGVTVDNLSKSSVAVSVPENACKESTAVSKDKHPSSQTPLKHTDGVQVDDISSSVAVNVPQNACEKAAANNDNHLTTQTPRKSNRDREKKQTKNEKSKKDSRNLECKMQDFQPVTFEATSGVQTRSSARRKPVVALDSAPTTKKKKVSNASSENSRNLVCEMQNFQPETFEIASDVPTGLSARTKANVALGNVPATKKKKVSNSSSRGSKKAPLHNINGKKKRKEKNCDRNVPSNKITKTSNNQKQNEIVLKHPEQSKDCRAKIWTKKMWSHKWSEEHDSHGLDNYGGEPSSASQNSDSSMLTSEGSMNDSTNGNFLQEDSICVPTECYNGNASDVNRVLSPVQNTESEGNVFITNMQQNEIDVHNQIPVDRSGPYAENLNKQIMRRNAVFVESRIPEGNSIEDFDPELQVKLEYAAIKEEFEAENKYNITEGETQPEGLLVPYPPLSMQFEFRPSQNI